MRPETLTLERLPSPVGQVLLVTDAEGAVRALDFADFEDRMRRLLARHAPGAVLVEGAADARARAAVAAYFAGDMAALGRAVKDRAFILSELRKGPAPKPSEDFF